jgi:chitinase
LAIAFYDDTYFGAGGGADTTPPSPSTTTWATAPHAVADRIDGTAVTTTDAGSPPVAYVFSVVLKDATPVYDIVQSTPDLATAGLTPGTQYDVQAKVRDAVGNYTTASTKVTVTTNAADVRTYRNPRNRRLFGR